MLDMTDLPSRIADRKFQGRLRTVLLVCVAHGLLLASLLHMTTGQTPPHRVLPAQPEAVRVHWVAALPEPVSVAPVIASPAVVPALMPVVKPGLKPITKPVAQPAVKPAPEPIEKSAPATAGPATVAVAAAELTASQIEAKADVASAVHYLHNPAPRYPRTARRSRAQGTVLLRVHIGPDGIPSQLAVQQSSGHPVLDQAALEAVRQWVFVAAREGAEARGAWVVVPLIFSLKERK